jgi:hypothetical protein
MRIHIQQVEEWDSDGLLNSNNPISQAPDTDTESLVAKRGELISIPYTTDAETGHFGKVAIADQFGHIALNATTPCTC